MTTRKHDLLSKHYYLVQEETRKQGLSVEKVLEEEYQKRLNGSSTGSWISRSILFRKHMANE